MPPVCHHIVPLSCSVGEGTAAAEFHTAVATLVWLDRPFAITCARVVEFLRERGRQDPSCRAWLGRMPLQDLEDRILDLDPARNLATLKVAPEELDDLGPEATFFNPLRWPPQPVSPAEAVCVVGFPRDQWPASLSYRFEVESVGEQRFGGRLLDVPMPGRLGGLCGAPILRGGRSLELVGVVTESLFHNEAIRGQHIRWIGQEGAVEAVR